MKKYIGLLILAFVGVAYAAGVTQKFPTDNVQMGVGSSSADKIFTFDTGDGGSNAKISVDNASPSFLFNKNLDVTGSLSTTSSAVIGGNSLNVGDGLGSNKTFTFDINGGSDPQIRWNNTDLALEFANDGTNFRKIGSGSGGGGGTNLLAELNADFEAGSPPSSWTASGGTFLADTTTQLYDKKSGTWDASALSQTLSSTAKVIERGMIGRRCIGEIFYQYSTGVSADYKIQAVLNGSTVVAEADIAATTSPNVGRAFTPNFDCPTVDTDTLTLRLIANVANPGLIRVDNAFIGSDRNTLNISQATFVGGLENAGAASCQYAQATSTSISNYVDLGTGTGCAAWTAESYGPGVISAFGTNDHRLVYTDMPPGNYIFKLSGSFGWDTLIGAAALFRLSDGTNVYQAQSVSHGANAAIVMPLLEFHVRVTTAGTRTYKLQGADSAALTQFWKNGTDFPAAWKVYRFPLNSSEALTLETSGTYWDVNIGGANPSLGTANVASYTEITNSALDMVLNSGSQSAQIPCSTTNPSTGLTCAAGNEGIGIVANIPYAGTWEVCGSFTHFMNETNTGSTGGAVTTFQWVETSNTSQTILQEGKVRNGSGIDTNGAAGTVQANYFANRNCGLFNFSSAGQKTLRLMYEQEVSGTLTSSLVLADRASARGNYDINITLKPWNQSMPAPIFTELQNNVKSGANGIKVGIALVTCDATPTVDTNPSNMLSSITFNSTGNCNYVFNVGFFSTTPNCMLQPYDSNTASNRTTNVSGISTTQATIQTHTANTGAAVDNQGFLTCWGL